MIKSRSDLRNSLRNRKFESRTPEEIFWRQFSNHLETLKDIFNELQSLKNRANDDDEFDDDEFNTFKITLARIYDLCVDFKDELSELQQKCDDNLQ